jgi:putative Mn2+ efflux pump MntP
MGAVIVYLLPLVIGAALLPASIILALFLLRGEGGVRKALAFAAGAMTVRLVQGVLFGYVFGAAADAYGESGSNLITSTLLLVVGLVMLISAVTKWRKEADPDAPPPKWMAVLGGLSALQAFGVGALLMALSIKQWVFTLSAIAVIEQGELSHAGNVLAYRLFMLAAQSLVLAPILVSAVAPTQAARMLDAMQGWLERNSRVIVTAVLLIFGVWLLWKGIAGLIG